MINFVECDKDCRNCNWGIWDTGELISCPKLSTEK